ncbi:MAG: HlyC/CorC family transporter [Proteobacteria bacterium]|nr:HlyC/CorC family transporter [Pseudomonadota bacterium]
MNGGDTEFFSISLIAGATVLNALVSAADSAVTAAGFMKGKQLLEDANESDARAINLWLTHPERLNAAIVISNTLIISAISSALALEFNSEKFTVPGTLATLITLALILVFGKLIPKSYASARSDKLVMRSLRILTALQWIMFPLVLPMATASLFVMKKFGGTGKRDRAITEEEIEYMVEEGEKAGVLEETKKEMIVSVFDLSETRVREIMTPRTAIDALSSDVTFDELMKVALETGHSRLPVYQETIDHVVGIILVKDLLQYAHHRGRLPGEFSIAKLMRAPFFVPETKLIIEVFKDLKRSKNHMAVVIDEYGGTAGIVTLEDILEEIVGEIQDEHDTEEANFVEISDGVFHVQGSTNIYEFFDEFGIAEDYFSPEDIQDADTIGGFVAQRLGQLPEAGQKLTIGNLQVEVLQITRHRVHLLAVHTTNAPTTVSPEHPKS